MQSRFHQYCLAFFILFALPLNGCVTPNRQAARAESNSVLIFSHTTGFRHKSIETGVSAMAEMVRKKGMVPIISEDPGIFERGEIEAFRAIILINNTTNPKEPTSDWLVGTAGDNFQRWLGKGGAVVGVHAATDSHYFQKWYGTMMGAYFQSHPKGVRTGKVTVVDPSHPSVKDWSPTEIMVDEWYVFRNFDPSVRLIATLDPVSIGEPAGEPRPIAWSKEFGGGRIFYTAMGHSNESYANPKFISHVSNGLNWAMAKK